MTKASHESPVRLHGWCTSPFSQKVLLALDHQGIDFEWVPAPLLLRGELRARTGDGKVPVLQVGDVWIADSSAIVAWADARVPDRSLYPEDPWARQMCRIVEDWADESLTFHAHAAYWTGRRNVSRLLAGAAVDRPVFETRAGVWLLTRIGPRMFRKLATSRRTAAGSLALLHEQLDMLEGALQSRPFVCGDTPTIADYAVGGQLINLWDLERDTFFADRGATSRWLAGLASRLPARFRVAPEAPLVALGDTPARERIAR